MASQNEEYDCCYCTLVNLLKFISKHCKHFHDDENCRDTEIMWIDDDCKCHFKSYSISHKESMQP